MSVSQLEKDLFEALLAELESRGYKLAIAESLTGGLLSSSFVAIEGASRVFLGSVVAYQDSVKQNLLGVSAELLKARGAVSSEVAIAMASGVLELFARETNIEAELLVSISTTGMASESPNASGLGDLEPKPQGLVFVAVQVPGHEVEVLELKLSGSRTEIREQSAIAAARLLQSVLQASS
jgi:nicotinamide-nucleotide amidase